MEDAIVDKLTEYCPLVSEDGNDRRFSCEQLFEDTYTVWDCSTRLLVNVPYERLKFSDFDVVEWFMSHLEGPDEIELSCMELPDDESTHQDIVRKKAAPSEGSYSALERNAVIMKDITQIIPKPIAVVLKLERIWLEKPLPIQLAIQGSRSKRYFNVSNLQNYDIILGTSFLYQHQGEVKGPQVSALGSRTTGTYEENILPDALSRLYEYDEPGKLRPPEEYLQYSADAETSTTNRSVLSAPLFVGVEALATSPRRSFRLQQKSVKRAKPPTPPQLATSFGCQPCITQKGPPPPAETSRPETGAAFEAWMCDHFVLLRPGERKKGGVGTGTQHNNRENSPNELKPHEGTSNGTERSILRILVTYPHEGLSLQIKGQYHKDPFYKRILDSPQEFKTFEVSKDGYTRNMPTKRYCAFRISKKENVTCKKPL
ncbi:hypothetical protein SCLCIDRAFT_32499 [Scleroderma citrinum Foug A]|uniref:Uncharacterized protein n=1 Tax=Scleroderma citrinum Foug A TaxID=1036808 RepID=A0A0C3D991_9AGAM|nr:hypothetical protein SCLCIDRAFT_32499 [Scleroderma citrinum Foug A]